MDTWKINTTYWNSLFIRVLCSKIYMNLIFSITYICGMQNATAELPADKVVTKQDAEAVGSAELRSNTNLNQATQPGVVAASLNAAARLNENVNACK
jgi:hypothetical protein